ncbi:MAG: hypothetical protein Q9220_001539 [cf. Caloplaca sp. 1 TL-2023]
MIPSFLGLVRYRLVFGVLYAFLTFTFLRKLSGGSPGHGWLPTQPSTLFSRTGNQAVLTDSSGYTGQDPPSIAAHSFTDTFQYFVNHPLPPSAFGELGERTQILRHGIEANDTLQGQLSLEETINLSSAIDNVALSMFPFLRNPSQPHLSSISGLRQRVKPGTKAILIPTGKSTFRYACHLISNLRETLGSKLPIEIFYAGDEDLPEDYRDYLTSLGRDIITVDITQVVDDASLDLRNGAWAIKAFSVIASQSEQVMVIDADAVFLQQPETIFDQHTGYKDTGALLFHDRLLWKSLFKERHNWWRNQMKHGSPSKALSKSRVYNEGWAEECDSGVVVLDKRRLSILLGSLHIAWQNMKKVREEWTYKIQYGDKESWWFGLELAGAEYTFEEHYGGVIGHARGNGTDKVCGFTIAHPDEKGELLWFNGSLLKSKLANATDFDVPEYWMLDGTWQKNSKAQLSCMSNGTVHAISTKEREIVAKSVERAQDHDRRIANFTLLSDELRM